MTPRDFVLAESARLAETAKAAATTPMEARTGAYRRYVAAHHPSLMVAVWEWQEAEAAKHRENADGDYCFHCGDEWRDEACGYLLRLAASLGYETAGAGTENVGCKQVYDGYDEDGSPSSSYCLPHDEVWPCPKSADPGSPASQGAPEPGEEGSLAALPCYCTRVDDGIGGTVLLPDVPCPRHDGQRAVRRALADLYGSNEDPHTPRMPDVESALEAVYAAAFDGSAPPPAAPQAPARGFVDPLSDDWEPDGDETADAYPASRPPVAGAATPHAAPGPWVSDGGPRCENCPMRRTPCIVSGRACCSGCTHRPAPAVFVVGAHFHAGESTPCPEGGDLADCPRSAPVSAPAQGASGDA